MSVAGNMLAEGAGGEAVEVSVLWNGAAQLVVHRGIGARDEPRFEIGEEPGCDFPVMSEVLGGATRVPLIEGEGGEVLLTVPADCRGAIHDGAGSAEPLVDRAARDGSPSPHLDGARSLELPRGGAAELGIGPWTFRVRRGAGPGRFTAPLRVEWPSKMFAGLSFGLHMVFLGLVFLVPPDASGLVFDRYDGSNPFHKYMLTPPEMRQEPVPEILDKPEDQDGDPDDAGKRHRDEEGRMGRRDAPNVNKRSALFGPRDNKDIRMKRDTLKDMARTAGVLSYFASMGPVSPFGSNDALGNDPESTLGHLLGDEPGNAFGYEGLGVYGTGRGGGGDGSGTFGVTDLGFIDRGRLKRGTSRAPRFRDRGDGDHTSRGPRVRDTGGTVRGTISKDVIRRVVRRHRNEISHCYEKGLAKRPDIAGRVTVRFIIDGNGAVQMAAVSDSTLGDGGVEQCIARTIRRMAFPRPTDGGVVIVNYPFTLTSSEG